MMRTEHATTTFCCIQSLQQIIRQQPSLVLDGADISIKVGNTLTDGLLHSISQSTTKYLDRGCSRCFVIRNQSADAFQIEFAVSFKKTRQLQTLRQNLRQHGIIPCFLKSNPRGHCVKTALQTEDDNETSIFTSLCAKAASGWSGRRAAGRRA